MKSNIWSGLCEKCDHKSCCNDYVTPFLTSNEFLDIKNIKKENFAEEVLINNIKGYALKKKENSEQCIFWNNSEGCTIYQNRPFDCKLFPFDIYKINGQYIWVVYSCNEKADWKWSEQILEKLERDVITKDVIDHLDAFSDLGRLDASDKSYSYIKLREVKINFNTT